MSSRVYRPLAVFLLGLLYGGGPKEGCTTDPAALRFAVARQCSTSPAAYAREFRDFSRCVERELKQLKALPAPRYDG